MSEASVESGRELLNVEILIYPFAVASLETGEAASIVPLKPKITEPISCLQTGA
jgi:hypothetical protein